MKGVTHQGNIMKLGVPRMSKATRVPSAKNLRGQGAVASSTKVSATAGFGASRKKGSVRGSH